MVRENARGRFAKLTGDSQGPTFPTIHRENMGERMPTNQTNVSQTYPWGLYARIGHRVLCSDGKIRSARLAPTPDTFFSIPASVCVRGKWVSGYVTSGEVNGERVYSFRAVKCGKNHNCLPEWPDSLSPDYDELMSKAFA